MTGGYSSSACVVDGTLILTLPDAVTPVVWRMDLGPAKASALEVRNNDDKTFTLILKTPRGDVNDIATFAVKAQAVRALMAVSRALEQAHGQALRPAPAAVANDAPQAAVVKKGKGKILSSIIAIVLLIGLIALFVSMGPRPVPITGGGDSAPASAESFSGGDAKPGVPMSADDFLRSR